MANTKISALTGLTTPTSGDLIPVVDVLDTTQGSSGTTKKITFSNFTSSLATSGANSNITSLTGLSTPLTVAQGGTGAATLTGIIKGSGTSAFTAVTAPSGTIVGTSDSQALTNKTYNGLTLTTTTGTLTIASGKTVTLNNTLTFSGTDSTTMTLPATSDTLAGLGTAQTFTATQTQKQVNFTINAITAVSNAATVPITFRVNNVTNSSAATLTITLTTTSAVDGQLSEVRIYDFSAAAQTITWVNTENSSVTAPTTSNGSTTLPLSVLFQYNSATSKWRCIGSA